MYDGMKRMTKMSDSESKKVFNRIQKHYEYINEKINNINQ